MLAAVEGLPGVIDAYEISRERTFDSGAYASVTVQMADTASSAEILDVVTAWGETHSDDSKTRIDIQVDIGDDCHLTVDDDADDPRLSDTADFFVALCDAAPGAAVYLELGWTVRSVFVNTMTDADEERLDALAQQWRELPGAQVEHDHWRIVDAGRTQKLYQW
ncbi:hypothetical protein [uncultured Microbacterium sp.]|uniref:hypothetical protein n=1 Tax=uncultured Microbacterium sp. TaxID=191216 RepID=UPI002630B13A|nr:hypothetical protein [uncultured Microbacterium sp.]